MKKPKSPRSAGAVVFRRTERGIRILVLRAFRNWDFPKGLVETGEAQADCARREVAEETGLADLDWPFGEEFKETLPYGDHKKVARYYLCETGEHDGGHSQQDEDPSVHALANDGFNGAEAHCAGRDHLAGSQ